MRDLLHAVFEAWRPSEARDSQDLTLVQRLALEGRPCECVELPPVLSEEPPGLLVALPDDPLYFGVDLLPSPRKRLSRGARATEMCERGELNVGQLARSLLNASEKVKVTDALWYPRLERAIGVDYLPETERLSHHFHARLSDQFDAVLHFDETRAVEPLERTAEWEVGEAPETFPFGV